MKKFSHWLTVIICVILIIAFFTKPSHDRCVREISDELNARGYKAGLYLSHDKDNPNAVFSLVTVKDRIFYKDIYFEVEGEDKKIAIAAFTKIFLVN